METKSSVKLVVTSNAFKQGELIPPKYTCDSEDISPDISWKDAPEKTKCFVLISDDPDAPIGTWDHWIVYNIPSTVDSLTEAASSEKKLPENSIEGLNSWGKTQYGGPCPPSGTHRYFFKLYALDIKLDMGNDKANKRNIIKAMEGHILGHGELMGKYKRQK